MLRNCKYKSECQEKQLSSQLPTCRLHQSNGLFVFAARVWMKKHLAQTLWKYTTLTSKLPVNLNSGAASSYNYRRPIHLRHPALEIPTSISKSWNVATKRSSPKSWTNCWSIRPPPKKKYVVSRLVAPWCKLENCTYRFSDARCKKQLYS